MRRPSEVRGTGAARWVAGSLGRSGRRPRRRGFFSFPALPERFSASRQLIRHSADRLLSNFEGGVSALKLSRLSCPKWSFEAFGCFLRGIGAECRAECRAEPVAPGPKAPGPSPGRPLGRWAGAGRRPRRAPRAPGPEPPRQRLRGRRGRGGESEPGAMAGGVGGGGACESCPPVAALLFLASGI